MKKISITLILIFVVITANSQEDKSRILQDLEQEQSLNQNTEARPVISNRQDNVKKARLTSASRLFGDKNDLTSVIMVLPAETEMEIIDSDSTYLHVVFEDYEAYILARHAEISEYRPSSPEPEIREPDLPEIQEQPVQERKVSRFTYLESKYGSNMAARLMAGKIWKGMNGEMIKDSWGNPRKINRVISGNVIKEEWIFKNTWLYLENDILAEWGPIE